MRIISRKALREFGKRHPDSQSPLATWYALTRKAKWGSLVDTRKDFPHADLVGICTVFNIKGNSFRLITKIAYKRGIVYIRFVMTHGEYDNAGWRQDCGYGTR